MTCLECGGRAELALRPQLFPISSERPVRATRVCMGTACGSEVFLGNFADNEAGAQAARAAFASVRADLMDLTGEADPCC